MKNDSSNLDLLRAYAVVLVVISHMKDEVLPDWNTRALGFCGVALFFVHTTLVLLSSLERHGPEALPFFVRRAFRLYPLAMVSVLLFALMFWLGKHPLSLAEVVSNMLLLQHVTWHPSYPPQMWTLPYEMEMYLVLPAIYACTRMPRPLLRFVALYAIGLTPALAVMVLTGDWTLPFDRRSGFLVYGTGLAFIPCFLPGVLAFVLGKRVRRMLSPAILALLVVGGSVAISAFLPAREVRPQMLWALCLAVGLTIPFCRETTFKPLKVLGAFIAKYSYSIYLTHIVVIVFTVAHPGPWYIRGLQFIVLQIAVSVLLYQAIEVPGIRLGARIAARLRGRPVAAASPLVSSQLGG